MFGAAGRKDILDRVLALQSPAAQHRATQVVEHGTLSIDLAAMQARWSGQPLAFAGR